MKKLFTLTFILLLSIITFAQKTISGNVKNEDGKPLPSASVTIEEIGKNAILNYAITDGKGNYKVTFSSSDAKILVKVKAFNHETILENHNNETHVLNFTLNEKATEIKEVKLKTKLITKRGDTISYDLKSFESKADRTLADVLKKIPGIEVNKDGSVLYQGEPINKFYVNGKDLMEGSYGVINNSLPKDAVQKVEVLENHQPVKILQDKLASENAAINVKLKKSVTMTGRGEVSSGFGEPWLWNVKLTPMLFTPKVQWLLNYKTNNVGESVENENNILAFGNRFEGTRRNVSQSSWLDVEKAQVPSNINEKRYLYNNVHFFSANLLTNLSKDWEFKANASYSNNNLDREYNQTTLFSENAPSFAGQSTYTNIVNKSYKNQSKTEIIFTKNAKKGFFKNTTTFNGFWNDDRATVNRKEIMGSSIIPRNADENNNSPTSSFQNSLSAIIPWKEKMVNVMSYINYKKDKQDLYFSPSSYANNYLENAGNYQQIHQNLNTNNLEINHSASVGFTIKKLIITPEVGLNLSYNALDSNLFGVNGSNSTSYNNNYTNDLKWNNNNPYAQVMLNYKNDALNVNVVLPINYYKISYQDNILQSKNKDINRTIFEPTLFAYYDFASFWKAIIFSNINYSLGDFGSLYSGKIMLTPNYINNKDVNVLSQTINKNVGGRIEYRNPLNNLFFNVRYNYGLNDLNTINVTKYLSATEITQAIEEFSYTPHFTTESAEIGKYFPKYKTNASLTFSNRDSNSFQKIIEFNSTQANLIETKSNSKTFGVKFNNNYFSWMSVDYNASFSWNENKNLYSNKTSKTSSWYHSLTSYFYPLKDHTIGFYWDLYNSKNSNTNFTNPFYDVSYQYTWAKKKIDFELKWMNIANTKLYQTITEDVSRASINTTSMKIRPSQVLFTLKFNFK